jgi:hypothetical protein
MFKSSSKIHSRQISDQVSVLVSFAAWKAFRRDLVSVVQASSRECCFRKEKFGWGKVWVIVGWQETWIDFWSRSPRRFTLPYLTTGHLCQNIRQKSTKVVRSPWRFPRFLTSKAWKSALENNRRIRVCLQNCVASSRLLSRLLSTRL